MKSDNSICFVIVPKRPNDETIITVHSKTRLFLEISARLKHIRSHIHRVIGILSDMVTAIPEFLLFAARCASTVYLPLFLNTLGYTATAIGLLFAFFNAAGYRTMFCTFAFIPLAGLFAYAALKRKAESFLPT